MAEPSLSRRKFLRATACGAATGLGAVALGRIDTRWVSSERVDLALPRWTLDGYRIGFLSDSHLTDGWSVDVTRAALDFLIAEKPDVIVFGGDFVETSRQGSLTRLHAAFESLPKARIPAVAILGNHDEACAVPNRVVKAARAVGFHVLREEALSLGPVTFVGLSSISTGRTDPAKFAHLKSQQNVVALLHEPDGVDRLEGLGSVMLAGHSHGGQICLPGGFAMHTPPGARRYLRGFYPNTPTPLYVSRGVGVTGVRIRLFCPPETTILTLRSQAGSS
jgi:predicted MPP superfamily phosphohydrolase